MKTQSCSLGLIYAFDAEFQSPFSFGKNISLNLKLSQPNIVSVLVLIAFELIGFLTCDQSNERPGIYYI